LSARSAFARLKSE